MLDRFRNWRIERQVVTALLVAFVAIAIGGTVFVYRAELSRVTGAYHEQNLIKSHLLHGALSSGVVSGDRDAVRAVIDEMALHDPTILRVVVRDTNGRVLDDHVEPERSSTDTRRYAQTFIADGENFGTVEAIFGLDAVLDEAHENIAGSLALLLVPLLLFTLLAIILVRGLVLGPMSRITDRLVGIAAGDHDTLLPRSTSGELTRLSFAVNDLSDHIRREMVAHRSLDRAKRVVDALRHQNELILNSAGDGICGLDRDGRFTFVNRAAEHLLGWGGREMIGKPHHELLQPRHADGSLYPADRSPIRDSLDNGTMHSVSSEVFWTRGGGSIPVEYICSPILQEGEVTGAVIVFHDITDRLHAEEELRFAASTFDGPAAIVVTDPEGRILRVNRAFSAMSGYGPDEVIGREVGFQKSGRHDRAFYESMWRDLVDSGRWEGELWNRNSDGEIYPVWQTIQALKDDDGNTTHYISQATDIGYLKRIESDLREAVERAKLANRAKAEFLAMMSHEIRTPLNGVLGMLGLMQDTRLDVEQRNYVRIARESGEALLEIISDILDFSKIEAGKLDFEVASIDLRYMLDGVRALFEPRALEKGLSLDIRVDDAVPLELSGDPGRIRQVLLNLVSNAVKYTESGGVDVRLSLVGERDDLYRVRFEVTDTGIGVPEPLQEVMFSEFTTIDASYSRRYGGTGLGLAICRKLVGLMGGTIDFTSKAGEGSQFWFELELPLSDAEPSTMLLTMAPSDFEPVRHARILLAEDVAANRQVAKSMLERLGHRVDVAANGIEAVEAIRHFPYDVVLMDISMPEMDGLQAMRAIRAMPGRQASVPIIAMTAHAMVGDREGFLAAGMDDYLEKPVNRDRLAQVVTRWSGARSSHADGRPQRTVRVTDTGSASRLAGPPDEAVPQPDSAPEPSPPEPPAGPVAAGGAGTTETAPESSSPVDPEVLRQLAEDTSEELLPVLVNLFITDARGRIERINAALEPFDGEVVRHESHALGSSAATYGLPGIHRLARAAEGALRSDQPDAALEHARRLVEAADEAFEALADATPGPA